MSAPLNVRYVLISDYAAVDNRGKLVVAGLYTEDLVIPSVPSVLGSFIITILAESPTRPFDFVLTVEMPSGGVLMGGDGTIGTEPATEGARPRTVLGLQFNQVVLPEGGEYKIMIADRVNADEKFEIHRFRVIVNPGAHAAAGANVSPPHTTAEPNGKRSQRPI
jgi:hypothetical protein